MFWKEAQREKRKRREKREKGSIKPSAFNLLEGRGEEETTPSRISSRE
jgi:hypothetical protein